MRCLKCHKLLRDEWNYCPYCGTRIERNKLLSVINGMIKGLLKGLVNNNVKVMVKTITTNKIRNVSEGKPIMLKGRLVEPETKVISSDNVIRVIIKLPGVKSMSNVSITRLSESIEVRAVSGKNSYFKIVQVPTNYHIINKSISNEQLSVVMSSED